jgi:hypothetical protein
VFSMLCAGDSSSGLPVPAVYRPIRLGEPTSCIFANVTASFWISAVATETPPDVRMPPVKVSPPAVVLCPTAVSMANLPPDWSRNRKSATVLRTTDADT